MRNSKRRSVRLVLEAGGFDEEDLEFSSSLSAIAETLKLPFAHFHQQARFVSSIF